MTGCGHPARRPGTAVVIAFPDMARARGGYESPAYREIPPLRTRHMAGDVVLVPGVAEGFDRATTAVKLWVAAAGWCRARPRRGGGRGVLWTTRCLFVHNR